MDSLKEQLIIAFLPNGQPAPYVLTDDEVVEMLRLDGKDPKRTLKYYRDEGLLEGKKIGKRTRYVLPDIIDFLNRK